MNGHAKVCRHWLPLVLVLAAVPFLSGDANWHVHAAGANPHEPTGAAADTTCAACHRHAASHLPDAPTRTVLPKDEDFVVDPVAMCVSCHDQDEREGSHPVGARPEFPVPADLPLDKDGRISCLTCHHNHGNIESDHQCASASALDRLFNRKHLRKSYLLRRENIRGELCKACHQTTATKKNKEKQP